MLTTGIVPAVGGIGMVYVVYLPLSNINLAGGAASAFTLLQTALTPIANVVDNNYTVVAKMAKQ